MELNRIPSATSADICADIPHGGISNGRIWIERDLITLSFNRASAGLLIEIGLLAARPDLIWGVSSIGEDTRA